MVCTDGGRSKAKQCSENMLRFHRTQSLHTEQTLGLLQGAKYVSKLDANSGFW